MTLDSFQRHLFAGITEGKIDLSEPSNPNSSFDDITIEWAITACIRKSHCLASCDGIIRYVGNRFSQIQLTSIQRSKRFVHLSMIPTWIIPMPSDVADAGS